MAVTEGLEDAYAPTAPRTPGPGTEPPRAGGLVGRRVGVYEILEQVGSGGMGVVYRAKDRSLDREVALKVLQPFLAQDAEYEQRFVREARTAAKLDHPHIVQIYAAGRFEDVLFIAMQLVRGTTLHQHTRARGKFAWREALGIVRQAAEALGAAHKAGLVHRDIKPNNIMLDEAGRVKLMDFGLMRSRLSGEAITRSGDFFGTPEYASPEQCETAELDGRSDLYSLGAVLYEMLSGRMPHRGETPMALFKKILEEEPVPLRSLNPDVPAAVEAVVRRMMAKRPSDRFANADELVAEIDRVLGGGRAARARRPWAWAASIASAAALAVAAWALASRSASHDGAVTPPPKPERLRLVVFDLRNGLPDPNAAWYEIALSDMLIAALAQQPSLDVPPRDQLLWKVKEMRLAGQAPEDQRRQLVQELQAGAYLSGMYYVRGGKVRVTLTGYRLPENAPAFPTRIFEKPEDQIFALVDEAARAVAHDLRGAAAESLSRAAPVRPLDELALAWRSEARAQEGRALKETEAKKESADKAQAEPLGKRVAPAPPGAPAPVASDEKSVSAPGVASAAGAGGALPAAKPAAEPKVARVQAQQAPPQPGADRGQSHAPAGGAEHDRMRAWYKNRQALEQCKLEKEDFEALAQGLASQFKGRGPGDEAAGFRRKMEQAREVRGRAGGRIAVEFACPGCGAVSAEFSHCAGCDRYLILKVRVNEPGKKE